MPRPKVPPKPTPLMTPKEVAAILRVSPVTIRRYVNAEKLEYVRLENRMRFTEAQVADFVKRMSTTGAKKP